MLNFMKFCELVLEWHSPQNFRHDDFHFQKTVNSCSGHPKACKMSTTGNLQFLRKQHSRIIFIEESKNSIIVSPKELFPHKLFEKLILTVS